MKPTEKARQPKISGFFRLRLNGGKPPVWPPYALWRPDVSCSPLSRVRSGAALCPQGVCRRLRACGHNKKQVKKGNCPVFDRRLLSRHHFLRSNALFPDTPENTRHHNCTPIRIRRKISPEQTAAAAFFLPYDFSDAPISTACYSIVP